ncbi:MAG TPA: histidine phosphatase family protein [Candidatus Saccharimonadales bacterium]|nr:histidine phosphatase family protein [Candidatus Saccharimonadales bacterium]
MQHLYLLRHGQSEANAQHIVAGSHDSPLSPIGVAQAEYAGDTAKRYLKFDLIVSSPMSRALQTAHIIAKQIGYPADNILVIDDLRERNLGDVEGKDYTEAPHHNGNYEDAENVPGVEPIDDLLTRVRSVLNQLHERPEQSILIVAHNGCGRMLKVALAGEPAMAMYNQPRTENAIFYQLS